MLTVQNVSHDPFYNQAFEEYVYQTYLDDDIFLLWQNAPAVVVGSYQNICREVHVEALRQRGIPVVRRISGGGTVYHDLGNVNYTYIVRASGTVDYDAVLSPVIAALNEIGVPARKNRTCDIAIGDLKISGSAQRMTKGRCCTTARCCSPPTWACWIRSPPTGKTTASRAGGHRPPSVPSPIYGSIWRVP